MVYTSKFAIRFRVGIVAAKEMSTIEVQLPSTLTPLFSAQQVVCGYPISDVYASAPRYLYYALLVASLVVRTKGWLAHVFLGAAAAYAGTAAIEAFVLIANQPNVPDAQSITIPFISSSSVDGNATLEALENLITDQSSLDISPAVMEFDIDAILAITVTGYLVMLPVHCWSSTIRNYRARHLLIGVWNVVMLAGSICALILWPSLDWNNFPNQYRFCYPEFTDDGETTTSNGWDSELWRGDWNSTIWNAFANITANLDLSQSCLYPCFNTSQIMRQSSSIEASLNVENSPRTNSNLSNGEYKHFDHITDYIYAALALATLTALFLLLLTLTRLNRLTRIPVHKPALLWSARKELWHATKSDVKTLFHSRRAYQAISRTPRTPANATSNKTGSDESNESTAHPSRTPLANRLTAVLRLLADAFALTILLTATILIPVVNIAFIVWIEWYISKDIVSKETPQQVGQWSPLAAIGLVLVSAAILQARPWIASEIELRSDIERYGEEVRRLEGLLERKKGRKERGSGGRSGEGEGEFEMSSRSD